MFSVRTDGSGLMQLTRSQGGSVDNGAASWSPDGTKIVFTRSRHRSSRLYVMNADGTAVTQVTHGDPRKPWWKDKHRPGGGAAAWGSHR